MTDRQDDTTLQLALECLSKSGRLRFRATGASMLPAIPSGSCVVIRRAAPEEPAVGDVILARAGNGVRLHRLVEIRRDGADTRWITRGDNNDRCDPPLCAGQILGVSIHVEQPERLSWRTRLSVAALRIARAV